MIEAKVRDALQGERTSPRTAPDEILRLIDKDPDETGRIDLPNEESFQIRIFIFSEMGYHLIHSPRFEAVTFLVEAQMAQFFNGEYVDLNGSAEDLI